MTDLAFYETCECHLRETEMGVGLDSDGNPIKPAIVACGLCGFAWCERCHPAPSARSWCEGTDEHEAAADDLYAVELARAIDQAYALLTNNGYTVTRRETVENRDLL